ncbi:hypothetical protein [Clostridium psychrophilum]|uniref:hypothetical protein n=1 Tax=Clostridium psychrophilum TaxID=132926 RepID=UPI001C0E013E|nr:hypothetical protein [Clostridium psychrophilum]MBU3180915.1 hypothetical protein [Clostridium psychrophilum]
MNYKEKHTGNKEKFYFYLKDVIIKLFKDKLKIDGKHILIPDNEDLNYEVEFNGNKNDGNFTIKVNWGQNSKQAQILEDKPKQVEKINDSSSQYEEFEEKSKLAENFKENFKENTNINSDGMEITTNVDFDYEPFEF